MINIAKDTTKNKLHAKLAKVARDNEADRQTTKIGEDKKIADTRPTSYKNIKAIKEAGYESIGSGFYKDSQHHLWRVDSNDEGEMILIKEGEDGMPETPGGQIPHSVELLDEDVMASLDSNEEAEEFIRRSIDYGLDDYQIITKLEEEGAAVDTAYDMVIDMRSRMKTEASMNREAMSYSDFYILTDTGNMSYFDKEDFEEAMEHADYNNAVIKRLEDDEVVYDPKEHTGEADNAGIEFGEDGRADRDPNATDYFSPSQDPQDSSDISDHTMLSKVEELREKGLSGIDMKMALKEIVKKEALEDEEYECSGCGEWFVRSEKEKHTSCISKEATYDSVKQWLETGEGSLDIGTTTLIDLNRIEEDTIERAMDAGRDLGTIYQYFAHRFTPRLIDKALHYGDELKVLINYAHKHFTPDQVDTLIEISDGETAKWIGYKFRDRLTRAQKDKVEEVTGIAIERPFLNTTGQEASTNKQAKTYTFLEHIEDEEILRDNSYSNLKDMGSYGDGEIRITETGERDLDLEIIVNIDSRELIEDYLTQNKELAEEFTEWLEENDPSGNWGSQREEWINSREDLELDEYLGKGGNTYNEDDAYFWGSVFEWTPFVTTDGENGVIITWHLGGDVRGNYSKDEIWMGDIEEFFQLQFPGDPEDEYAYLFDYEGDYEAFEKDVIDWYYGDTGLTPEEIQTKEFYDSEEQGQERLPGIIPEGASADREANLPLEAIEEAPLETKLNIIDDGVILEIQKKSNGDWSVVSSSLVKNYSNEEVYDGLIAYDDHTIGSSDKQAVEDLPDYIAEERLSLEEIDGATIGTTLSIEDKIMVDPLGGDYVWEIDVIIEIQREADSDKWSNWSVQSIYPTDESGQDYLAALDEYEGGRFLFTDDSIDLGLAEVYGYSSEDVFEKQVTPADLEDEVEASTDKQAEEFEEVTCEMCDGRGIINQVGLGQYAVPGETCPDCGGTGTEYLRKEYIPSN